ncbi:MAG: iron-containing alcohol dehydrogenase, partial [Endomicrobia bacterium]|nr:iron-containing alcohol dehydrogenase [Endomicrobiia bacterium]
TVSPRQTAISGIDALCHLVEGYISKKSNPICDTFAVEGIKYIVEYLPVVIKNPDDILAREKISLASLYGGIMIVNSGLTLAHGIGSVIGPRFNLPHGLACALFLPEVLEINLSFVALEKRETLKRLFNNNIEIFLKNFYIAIGLNLQLDIQKNVNLNELAKQILNTSSAKGNPKEVSEDELIKILYLKISENS